MNIDILSENIFLKSESFKGDAGEYLLISNDVNDLKKILNTVKTLNDSIVYRINVG